MNVAATVQTPLQFADLPGVRMAYRDTGGSGAAVILAHALTGNSASWEPQMKAFADAGLRAIAFDRRGWGDSVADPATGPQPATDADDIDALATYLKLDKFHLLGIAGGGFVALDYAAWRPERLRSLVVCASTGSVQEKEITDFSRRIQIPGVVWPNLHLEVGPSYIGASPEGVAKWQAIEHRSKRADAERAPLRSPNTFAKIATIRAPMLLVAGGADQLAPPALMRIWASHLKTSVEWLSVPEAGHSINWEYPQEFNAGVIPFLLKH
jgi:pimeloyl-ACP methyl ester carboxylesterase